MMEDKATETRDSTLKESVHKSFWNYGSDNQNTGFIKSDSYSDLSFWTLVISNLLVIIIILVNKLPVSNILFIYFFESLVAGLFNAIYILCHKKYSVKGPNSGPLIIIASLLRRIFSACFFLFFYCVVHGFFFAIISGGASTTGVALYSPLVLLPIWIFILNNLFSFFYSFKEKTSSKNPNDLAYLAFMRVLPMSFSLMLMVFAEWILIPFLFIRAGFDFFGHIQFRSKEEWIMSDEQQQEEERKEDEIERLAAKERPTYVIDGKTFQRVLRDPSFWTLILSNIYALYMILANDVTLATVLIIYWFQSVIIGIFNFIRMLSLKDFVSGGLQSGGVEVSNTKKDKISAAWFFFFHYNFFHLGYLIFIIKPDSYSSHLSVIAWASVIPVVIVFFLNHLFSFLISFKEQTTNQNLGALMFTPYVRVIPMHAVIFIWASIGEAALLPFLLIKILLDALGHVFKHATLLPHTPKRS